LRTHPPLPGKIAQENDLSITPR